MKLQEAQLGGANCCTDEFVDVVLIFGVEEKFPRFVLLVHVFLELLLVLDDMLKD